MNGATRKAAPPAVERALQAAVLALCAMLVLWEIWLAPIRHGGSWLALKALPLALALPGLFRGLPATRQRLSLLLPFYAAEGIVRAATEPGRIRVLALAEVALAVVAFVAIMVMARRAAPPPRISGFTAVELLVAVATIAMLATIAYPSYVGYKVRANRAAAQSFLIDLANRQQLHFLDARRYANSLAGLGWSSVPPEISSYYLIQEPVVDNAAAPPSFTLSAVARAGTMQARDGDLSINSAGLKAGHW
jgi:type IV pilus assembly protein PilE